MSHSIFFFPLETHFARLCPKRFFNRKRVYGNPDYNVPDNKVSLLFKILFLWMFKEGLKCIIYVGSLQNVLFNLPTYFYSSLADGGPFGSTCQIHGPMVSTPATGSEDITESLDNGGTEGGPGGLKSPLLLKNPAFSHTRCPLEVHKTCFCVRFIAEHTKMVEDSTKVS